MGRAFTRRCAAALLAIAASLSVAAAQGQGRFAEAQQKNQAALRQYSWQSRTELRVEGEVRQVRLEQVRFDLDGRLQKTVIGGGTPAAESSRLGPPGPAGALKKRAVARKKEAFQDMLDDLAALAESYAHLSPERLQAFGARAMMTQGQGLETGSVRLQGRDIARPGDGLTAWIDPASFAMRRVEITTFYEGSPVTITADYRRTDTGLTYQARSTLRYPAKAVEVVVETFDYTRALTR